jgi:hypothetical protein
MVEKVNLEDLEITSNFVLVKVDSNHDFIEIPGPSGTKIELQLIDFTHTQSQLQAITGTILKTPKQLSFDGTLKHHNKGITIAGDLYESIMRTSCAYDTELLVKEGDRIVFDLKFAIDAEASGLLVNVEGIGYAVLMPYDILFCKEVDGEFIPLNGWVFFQRDQKPYETLLDSGLWYVEKEDKYGSMYANVMAADKPLNDYLEKGYHDDPVELNSGDRIILQRGFGYRIAVDMFAGGLIGIEAVRRTKICAKLA